jgi:hypothetical protein
MNRLDELIPRYVSNKQELDDYKKICDKENAEIKEIMSQSKLPEYEVDGYVAKYSVSKRETLNEDKLIELLKSSDIDGGYNQFIKTKEYVDMDALEKAIYNDVINSDTIIAMDKCKEVKEVTTLRVSKLKKSKED